jgi:hypothetical protein
MKRHKAGQDEQTTLCGYSCTKQEYRIMTNRHISFVNCKKCLGLIK